MTSDKRSDDALDALFEQMPNLDPPAGLAERILADAPRPKRAGLLDSLKQAIAPNGRRWPAGAVLSSLAFGLFTGYAAAAQDPGTYDENTVALYSALGLNTYELTATDGSE